MRISHEAIYQALYVRGRGALRRELCVCLRTGRALRVPRARTQGRGTRVITSEVMISKCPAEAGDRAVPGHWQGDLILGLGSSAIGPWSNARPASSCCYICRVCPSTARPEPKRSRSGQARRPSPSATRSRPQHHAARATSPVADLRPGRRDGPTCPTTRRGRAGDVLLRPAQPLQRGTNACFLIATWSRRFPSGYPVDGIALTTAEAARRRRFHRSAPGASNQRGNDPAAI